MYTSKRKVSNMEQITLTFKADNQDLKRTGGVKKIASHTINYINTHFDLGHNWNGFDEVKAVWNFNGKIIGTIIDGEGNSYVPEEFLTSLGKIEVNLQGTIVRDGKLIARLTTFPITAIEITKRAEVGTDVF